MECERITRSTRNVIDRKHFLSTKRVFRSSKVHKGILFLSHKNKEQQVRAPANVNLFNQTSNSSISKNYNDGYRMSVW